LAPLDWRVRLCFTASSSSFEARPHQKQFAAAAGLIRRWNSLPASASWLTLPRGNEAAFRELVDQ
jgi:hypothetical protein